MARVPAPEERTVGGIRRQALGVAIATGLALGFREALGADREPQAVIVHDDGEPPPIEGVTLFFHPEVPEATLVLVR